MKAVETKTRISIKNILFATDFSPVADAAGPFAIQIARSYGAKVYGLHVNPAFDYTATAPDVWPAMTKAVEKENKEHAERLERQLKGVEHEVFIGEGNVWNAISKLIAEKQIDLLILGTHGRTGLGKVFLGSVAEQILRHAPCPVLTVGPHVLMEAETAVEMKQILYATDLALDFTPAADYAVSLAQENQARLTLLHVIDEERRGEFVHPSELMDAKLRSLRQLVPPEAELWCEPTCWVRYGEPAEKILEAAKELGASLIVLGARPAGELATHFAAGTVHAVVSKARCPVLTVRG
jgi:nucleotide-binding universal stress UspA family protein